MPTDLLDRPSAQGGLWPEHRAAVEAFLAVADQWRTIARFGARPIWLGLDYGAAEAGLRLAGVEMTPALWLEVRTIEAGAVAALNRE